MAPDPQARATLGELVRSSTEKVVSNKRADWPYVGLEHMASGQPALIDTARSSSSTSTNGVFHRGDVLFGKLRPSLRKCVGAQFSGYCSTDILVLRPVAEVEPSFAARALQHESVFLKAEANSFGTKMPRTSWAALQKLEVFCPQRPEQKRIAEILDTLDEAIRKTEQVIAKLQQVKQGLLNDLLTRGIDDHGELRGKLPASWDRTTFEECLESTPQNGLYKPSTHYGVDGYAIVRIDGFYDGLLAPVSSLKRLRLTSSERKTYGLAEGDILINRVNSIDFVGKAAVVPMLNEVVVFESNVMRCRLRVKRVDPRFANLWLLAPWSRHWFHRRAKSAIAQASVNQTDVKELPIALPSLEEQQLIVECWRRSEANIEAELLRLTKLRTLKQGLMDDLLTGRVRTVPSEPAL